MCCLMWKRAVCSSYLFFTVIAKKLSFTAASAIKKKISSTDNKARLLQKKKKRSFPYQFTSWVLVLVFWGFFLFCFIVVVAFFFSFFFNKCSQSLLLHRKHAEMKLKDKFLPNTASCCGAVLCDWWPAQAVLMCAHPSDLYLMCGQPLVFHATFSHPTMSQCGQPQKIRCSGKCLERVLKSPAGGLGELSKQAES